MFMLNNYIHSILFWGSFVNNFLSNALHYSEIGGLIDGNYNYVSFSTSKSFGIEVDSNGQNPYNISYKTTPRDHISAFVE